MVLRARRTGTTLQLVVAVLLCCAASTASSVELHATREPGRGDGDAANAAAANAVAALELALAARPAAPELLYELGTLYAEHYADRQADARRLFEGCLEASPSAQPCWRQIGILDLNAHRLADAMHRLGRAVDLDPSDLGALHRLEYASMMAAQLERDMRGIAFVTFASDGTRCELRRLRESAAHHGIDVEVLGVGQVCVYPVTRTWCLGLHAAGRTLPGRGGLTDYKR